MNNPKITSVGIAAALLLFSALLFGERAEAEESSFFFTGAALLKHCESYVEGDRDVCIGYLVGLSDAVEAMKLWGHYSGMCVPADVETPQLRKVVIKLLNERPEKLHLSASSLTINSLDRAFPCD